MSPEVPRFEPSRKHLGGTRERTTYSWPHCETQKLLNSDIVQEQKIARNINWRNLEEDYKSWRVEHGDPDEDLTLTEEEQQLVDEATEEAIEDLKMIDPFIIRSIHDQLEAEYLAGTFLLNACRRRNKFDLKY